MNESLINPFTLSHPTAVQTSLFAGATFARFDPTGRFIAAARLNGSAEIWDLETRAPIRWLDGHVKTITSIDWSRNSRYLLTSSKDWNVLIWDLASVCDPPQRHSSIRFDAPVVSASFHPKNSQIVLVLLATGEAYVCDMRKKHRSRIELLETILDEGEDEDAPMRSPMTVARFEPTGKNIFVGTASGFLLVFNTRTKTMIARHKISGAGAMKGLDFAKSGRRLVTNSSDRTLRQFILPKYPDPPTEIELQNQTHVSFLDAELEPTHRFNDPINRTAWHAMCYSPDGEWLAGGAADPAGHKIYIWDISNDGQFASALDGGREPLVYLHWHPTRSSLASTTNQGSILIWHCPNPERWGAFAGGFEEVDENVEYEEREDEFDIEDEAVQFERKMKAEEEEVDIDTIVTGAQAAASFVGGSAGGLGKGTQSGNMGGAATPVAGGKPNARLMDLDSKFGSVGDEIVDVETGWAEEEPDGDLPGGWKMKVIMDNEAAEYY
ncbi:WD40-repeat-containing domain protein [Flammula alnicola]|nr:WD40-repeat-containing domain protein [Flammula alnicola]